MDQGIGVQHRHTPSRHLLGLSSKSRGQVSKAPLGTLRFACRGSHQLIIISFEGYSVEAMGSTLVPIPRCTKM
jgi:hypothetical protein